MTTDKMIKYFKLYKRLDSNINRLLAEKDEWRARAEKVTQELSDMPRGGNGEDSRQNAIIKMIEVDAEIDKQIDDYVDLGREIKTLIDSLDNEDYKLLLKYKYLDGLSNEKIAEGMELSSVWVWQLHKRAIKALAETQN